MSMIERLGEQAASGLIGGTMGLMLGHYTDQRQRKQQQALQNMQIAGNKQMMDYSMQKQLEMWKATNFSAQVEELNKAGLNPGLIYGMSGGGATTTGTPAGNVQGANAPQGGGEIQAIAGMGIQMQMAASQRELLEAQKRNVDADTANKISENPNIPKQGVILDIQAENLMIGIKEKIQHINNLKAQEMLTKWQTETTKLENEFKTRTFEENVAAVQYANDRELQEIDALKRSNDLTAAQFDDLVKEVKLKNALMAIQAQAVQKNIQLTTEQIDKIKWEVKRIVQDWYNEPNRMSNENIRTSAENIRAHFATDEQQIFSEQVMQIIGTIIGAGILRGGSGGRGPIIPIDGFGDKRHNKASNY